MRTITVLTALLLLGVAPGLRADDSWTGEGVVVPKHTVSLRARSALAITEVLCDIGDQVKKGQALVRFDDRQAKAELTVVRLHLKKREVGFKEDDARLKVAKAHVERQKADLERLRLLRKDGAAGADLVDKSEADYKHSLAELVVVEAQVEMARVEVEIGRALLDLEELKLDTLTIRAPFDGIVAARNCAAGETVANLENPLVQLIAGPYLVEVAMPDRLLPAIKAKQPVEVIFDRPSGDKPVKAEIGVVSPVSDPQHRAFKLQITLPADAQLNARPGTVVKVKVPVKE